MDSPLAAQFFRRLHTACCCSCEATSNPSLLRRAPLSTATRPPRSSDRTRQDTRSIARRGYASKERPSQGLYSSSTQRSAAEAEYELSWRPRSHILDTDKLREFREYGFSTAEQLRAKGRRPRRLKMTMRDFVEDSLYNPAYGYFSSQAVIFNPGTPFDFPRMASEAAFNRQLDLRYASFEDDLDAKTEYNETRQLWHTPTELFRPHYAEAMARYLVANYKLSIYPYADLVIYELGAGNGTFMLNVLDYIRDTDPEVYDRTRYKIVEISAALAQLQNEGLQATAESRGHLDKVEIINESIFNWQTYEPSPCFVVALEVIDNFGHDLVRYNLQTEEPLQGTVLIDTQGEMYEFYTPLIDTHVARYLRVRDAACTFQYKHPLHPKFRRRTPIGTRLKDLVMGRDASKLSEAEYVPTRLMQFFDVLQKFFPAHRLLCSDFHYLPDTVEGINAPVVQTRFQRRIVPVTTPLVRQGHFDIFFPTDFRVMEDIYRAITGKLTRVLSHEDFLKRWAIVEETRTRNGENPLIQWYQNASVLTTV